MEAQLRGITLSLATALLVAACAVTAPVDRAAQLVRLHREGEAVTVLRDRLTTHPADVGARRMLVRVLAAQGDLDAAKKEVDELVGQLPGDPTPWIELGHAYELTHRFEDALSAYDSAARAAPASPKGPREGGMRAARWGEVDEALPRLEEAVRRGDRDAGLFHALGLVRLHRDDLDGATEAYKRGLAEDPKSLENVLGLATVAVMKGDAAAALAAYDRILTQRPSHSGAELGRAWALAKLGRVVEARRALDRAEELGAPRENVRRQRALLQ